MQTLKNLRLEKGLYQKDVAKAIGVDRTTYVKYERGDSEPSFQILMKLANFFNVSIDYLLGRETKIPVTDTDNGNGKNIVTMIGRDGRREKRVLTDEQFSAWLAMMEQMPDADNL